jgi:hypothetical protein
LYVKAALTLPVGLIPNLINRKDAKDAKKEEERRRKQQENNKKQQENSKKQQEINNLLLPIK